VSAAAVPGAFAPRVRTRHLRSYPVSPAGAARRMRDAEDTYLTALGHRMTWRTGHGESWLNPDPGYRGTCQLCGGVARLAWLGDGAGYHGYEGAMAKMYLCGPRRCTKGRRP
jgi:hypothetical protein